MSMRTGCLMIRKVVEFFVVNTFLRVVASLRLHIYCVEWPEVDVKL